MISSHTQRLHELQQLTHALQIEYARSVVHLNLHKRRIRRMVSRMAEQTGASHREVYVMAYHELFKRTGVHAVVQSANSDMSSALQKAADAGLLNIMADILTDEGLVKKAHTQNHCG